MLKKLILCLKPKKINKNHIIIIIVIMSEDYFKEKEIIMDIINKKNNKFKKYIKVNFSKMKMVHG